jgi:hypothetical protein
VSQVRSEQRTTAPGITIALILATMGMVTMSFGRTRLGEWTLSDLLFALAGVALIVSRMGPARKRHANRASALSPMVLGTGLLLTMATLSSFGAIEPMGSMMVVLRLAWLSLIWVWILQGVAPTVRDFEILVRGLRLTVFISSTVALGGYFGLLGFSETINETRETGLYDHPNHLGAMLTVGLPFIILDAPTPRRGPRKMYWRIGLTFYTIMAIMTTGSMTSVIGVVVVVATLVVTLSLTRSPTRRRPNPLMRLAGLFIIVLATGYFIQADTPVSERFESMGNERSGVSTSVHSRGEHADSVISNLDDVLVIGVGLDPESATINLDDRTTGSSEIHNIYLRLIHNAGLIALAGFIILVLTSLRNSWQLAMHSRGKDIYTTAVALTSSLVALNVVAQFRTPLYQRYFWVPMALIATLWVAYRNDLRKAQAAAVAADDDGSLHPAHGNGNPTLTKGRQDPAEWHQAAPKP